MHIHVTGIRLLEIKGVVPMVDKEKMRQVGEFPGVAQYFVLPSVVRHCWVGR